MSRAGFLHRSATVENTWAGIRHHEDLPVMPLKWSDYASGIYCISEGLGEPVKIGHSGNLASRLKALQHETWRDLRLYWSVPSTLRQENILHHILLSAQIRSEWFHDHGDTIKLLMPLSFAEAVTRLSARFTQQGAA